jgi:hypothetical protein
MAIAVILAIPVLGRSVNSPSAWRIAPHDARKNKKRRPRHLSRMSSVLFDSKL